MFFSPKAVTGKQAGNALPPPVAALLRESWWLALLALAIYLLLVLVTYDKADPGWSHSVRNPAIHNAGGVIGAYVADLLLDLFGVSAYWWVILCAALVRWGFRRIDDETEKPHSMAVALVGFAMLLLSSAGLEAVRLHTLKASLPLAPGGVMGAVLGDGLANALGFTGGTLIVLTLFAAGLSLFSGLSWLLVIERIGDYTERAFRFVIAKWHERQDRRVGEKSVIERDETVEVSKKKL
ncbi:MAG TPA: DNA translocase FtsK 4TM domain-containing protein, partial [Burkholderiales bacterium]|nr:DNA translocase FtsK 4TM domain-containing protein [Burkholderiales bacterium]